MKILAINGSPNTEGCTYTAISIVAKELEKEGIETEIVQLGKQPVQGCISCRKCSRTGRCVFDDVVNLCLDKAEKADGILIGSPVYYSGVAGQMKAFLDRFFYCGPDLCLKVGASVCSLRRSGGVPTFHQLNNYFALSQTIATPSQYWCCVHGNSPDEVMQDLEGLQTMRTLGKNMAWLLKVVNAGKETIPLPEKEARIRTNFIR